MFDEEYLYALAIRSSPLVGDVVFSKLIHATGSAKETWNLSKKLLKKIPGIGDKISLSLGNEDFLKRAEKELLFCEKNNIKVRLKHLHQLPGSLSSCEDAPSILFQKGDFNENLTPISIVGTRNMTAYGKAFIEELISLLKDKNALIVSGLALGTDGYAHAEALKNKITTVGILAHGLHTLYPSSHKKLAQEMLDNEGALLTEFTSSEKPDREHFLQRNRIVAGFSPVTVVVETAFGGGSISTVSYANDYNREVYALPGKVQDKYSQGCNQLIAQNKARIINRAVDILEEMGFNNNKTRAASLFPAKEIKLESSIQPIYEAIAAQGSITLDDLSEKVNIPPYKLLPILLDLELKSYIKTLSGKQYGIV